MLTAMTEGTGRLFCKCSRHRDRVAATRAGTTGSFSKPCTISWFATSLGGLFFGHWNSVWKRFWRSKPNTGGCTFTRTKFFPTPLAPTLLQCMSPFMMLWTAPPPARECYKMRALFFFALLVQRMSLFMALSVVCCETV